MRITLIAFAALAVGNKSSHGFSFLASKGMIQGRVATELHANLDPEHSDRRSFFEQSGQVAGGMASTAAFLEGMTVAPSTAEAATQMWKQVPLPFEDTLYDIDFDT
jgi:hypothetical protein